MLLKYYLTCDFTKDEAIDKVYLSIVDGDNTSHWAAVFTPTDDGGNFKEDYEYDMRDDVSYVVSILRGGDKERLVYGELIDDTNYGEWTVVECCRLDRHADTQDVTVVDGDDATTVHGDASFTPKNICADTMCAGGCLHPHPHPRMGRSPFIHTSIDDLVNLDDE